MIFSKQEYMDLMTYVSQQREIQHKFSTLMDSAETIQELALFGGVTVLSLAINDIVMEDIFPCVINDNGTFVSLSHPKYDVG